ncbi:hypothetical protein Tco_1412703 [Tanacetum coccineum]
MSNSNTNLQTQTSSVLQNVTVSSCSNSNIKRRHNFQEVDALPSLTEINLYLSFLSRNFYKIMARSPMLQRTFSQDLDLLEQHLTKRILSRTDAQATFDNDLITSFENAFHSEFRRAYSEFIQINDANHLRCNDL